MRQGKRREDSDRGAPWRRRLPRNLGARPGHPAPRRSPARTRASSRPARSPAPRRVPPPRERAGRLRERARGPPRARAEGGGGGARGAQPAEAGGRAVGRSLIRDPRRAGRGPAGPGVGVVGRLLGWGREDGTSRFGSRGAGGTQRPARPRLWKLCAGAPTCSPAVLDSWGGAGRRGPATPAAHPCRPWACAPCRSPAAPRRLRDPVRVPRGSSILGRASPPPPANPAEAAPSRWRPPALERAAAFCISRRFLEHG